MSDLKSDLPVGSFLPGSEAFAIKGKLGAGSYCDVYLVREVATNQLFAAKMLADRRIRVSEKVKSRFEREVTLFSRLKHPSLIGLKTILHHDNRMIPIFEYAQRGNLYDLLKHNDENFKRVSFADAYDWIVQLLDGVGYLHGNDIIHRDLTPKNILVRKTVSVAICDLGVALDKNEALVSERYKEQKPSIFVSEHQRENPDDATEQDDIYSLGQVFFYLLTNVIPRDWVGRLQEYNPEVPESMAEAIDAMRQADITKRPADIASVQKVIENHKAYADKKRF